MRSAINAIAGRVGLIMILDLLAISITSLLIGHFSFAGDFRFSPGRKVRPGHHVDASFSPVEAPWFYEHLSTPILKVADKMSFSHRPVWLERISRQQVD